MAEGKHQRDKRTGPLEALNESNFARESNAFEVDGGEPARVGYILEAYPSAGPALDSTLVRNTVASRGSLGNDGTSRDSYHIQPNLVDSDDPEEGDEGTGIPHEKGRASVESGEGHK